MRIAKSKAQTLAAQKIDKAMRDFCEAVAELVSEGDREKKVTAVEWVQMYSIFTQSVTKLLEHWQGVVQEIVGAHEVAYRREHPLGTEAIST